MRLAPAVLNSKPISQCTAKDFAQVRGCARKHAMRKGKGHLENDFASYVIEELVKQGTLKYNIHWMWATFLREELGSLKNKKGLAKASALTRPVPLEKALKVKDSTPPPTESIEWSNLISKFQPQMRSVVVLKFKWEMTGSEIGEVLGVTLQRVNQILKELEMLGHKPWFTRSIKGSAA